MEFNPKVNKERLKALTAALIAECKSATDNFSGIEALIEQGAPVCANHCKPLETACKRQNAALVEFLIDRGGADKLSAGFIAQMCALKGYDSVGDERFFALLDKARLKIGADTISLVTPYIHKAALCGNFEALDKLKKRYYLTDADIVGAIPIRIIFEIINNGYDDMLAYIEKSKSWIDSVALDLAVAGNEFVVLEYILKSGKKLFPGDKAVSQAVYEGYFAVLDMLFSAGYDFEKKGAFLFSAARAAYSKGTDSLEYLFKRGYTAEDRYNTRSLFENATIDGNAPLIKFLTKLKQEDAQ